MKIIIRPFSEIMIKSKPVRKRYLQILNSNISKSLKELDENIKTHLFYDKLEVDTPYFQEINKKASLQRWNLEKSVIKKLSYIPWIESFVIVESFVLDKELLKKEDNKEIFDFIFSKAKEFYLDKIENKTFVVRIKRSWKHNFTSIDLERYIWWWLLKFSKNSKVQLKNPSLTVKIEVKDENLYLVREEYFWIWGYPIWTQDKILSLISGWFDSWVSSFSMMKRGCKTDFLFFNLGGDAHKLWVKQVSYYLWKNFGIGYNSRIFVVPFENVIKELLEKVESRFRGVLLKRFFLKVADKLAKKYNYYAIVKWDSLGQVSSQTLKNMFVIDKASETLVLRPLISFNKQEIVDISKKIWTYDFACNMPEYCWVISDKPATQAKLEQVLAQEEKIDEKILDEAISNLEITYLKDFVDNNLKEDDIEISYLPWPWEVVIDIRKKEDIKKRPLILENTQVLEIDFTKINYEFEKLDRSKTYLFYCDKWVLSKLHALYLRDKWFKNIKLYRYLEKGCKLK